MNHNTHTFSWNAGKEKPTLSESVKPWLLRLCFLSSKGLVSGACHLCAGEFLQSRSQEILRGDSHLVLLQTTHLGLHLVGQILEKFHFLPFKSWNLTWQAVGPENEAVRGLVAFVLPWARPSVSMSFLGFWLQSDAMLGIHQKGNLPRRVLWIFGGNSLGNDSDDGQFNRSSWKSESLPYAPTPGSVQFSHLVVSNSLQPHELQHARPPCPSPTPGVHPNPCPLSQWCHPTISSSVIPFSSCLQFFPTSGSFPMSQLLAWGAQSIGVSVSTSVLPMNTQDWSPLGWTGWISLQSKGLSRVFSNTTVQKHQIFSAQLSL